MSGHMPIPGATVSISLGLSAEKISTWTDIDGSYSAAVPSFGSYKVQVDMAAFASATEAVTLDASRPNAQANFELTLLSRTRPLDVQQRRAAGAGNGGKGPGGFQRLSITAAGDGQQSNGNLASDLPATDLPLYLGSAYFRLDANKFSVPISLVVPGSQIPFVRSSDRDKATLDLIGIVTDKDRRLLTTIRDTAKLALDTSAQVKKKNVQYDTALVLPSGRYHLKLVVRENETGRMGSFETDLDIPEQPLPLKMSSVVLSSQLLPAKKDSTSNPLLHDGSEIVPSVTHVFSVAQHLFLYYEVYDPGRSNAPATSGSGQAKPGIHLLTNVTFFRGKAKVFESSLVELTELNGHDRKTGVFQLELPLSALKPGFYTCQVNVIDDAAGQFLFPRVALLIRSESATGTR
jgi:hypothetical protein